jgi:RNA-directed DNA polymerase
VRRVHIPKGDGKESRPIGIPTFEDKVLQRAVTMVLEAIYEQDFLNCSYGFRPRRSAHQALGELWRNATKMAGGWIVEVDIRKYFDTIDHGRLREILSRRVRDGVLLRLIGKWLKAGVMEDGSVSYPDAGSPQGGVVSPMLANIYLHEVLDVWFEQEVKPRLRRRAYLVRYADDAVMLFEEEQDAERVMEVLPKRFGKYGLALHPDKTRLVAFKRPDRASPSGNGGPGKPGTFDLLGFTHHWARALNGKWVIRRRTAKGRFRRGLKAIAEWCRKHRHDPVETQRRALGQKLRGHYRYYGLIGNADALWSFLDRTVGAWRKWLNRRSQKAHMTWARMQRLLEHYKLPQPNARALV